MLDKDKIISVSEVEKIPTDEKDYLECSFMCFTLYSHNIQRADQQIADEYRDGCLPTRIQCS